VEPVPLNNAFGRVLAEDIRADADLPAFTRSRMDGYAVRAVDTIGAKPDNPVILPIAGTVKIGCKPEFSVPPGMCAAIPTGGELPDGCDAVVMAEDCAAGMADNVPVFRQAAPGQYIVPRGMDAAHNTIVLEHGSLLRPQEIGALAALGYSSVNVRKRPKVAIISTGDELVSADHSVSAAQVRDINGPLLAAAVAQAGGEPMPPVIVRDGIEALSAALLHALDGCNTVLISGGSSVGTADLTALVMERFGRVCLHGVAMKPGKPAIVGDLRGKPVFGLPGHPVSAAFVFRLLVAPLLLAMIGQKPGWSGSIGAILGAGYESENGREEYVPVALTVEESGVKAYPAPGTSGTITSLTRADGYIRLGRYEIYVQAGTEVEVYLF